jgi:hypothetical protein
MRGREDIERLLMSSLSQSGHELVQAFGVYFLTHDAARSKLTSFLMRALYFE